LKRIEAHISWVEAKSAIGEHLVEFQLLEMAIRDAIAFLICAEDLKIGSIATNR
jgi:hypothetical protein